MRIALLFIALVFATAPVAAQEKPSLPALFAQRFPVTLKVLDRDFPDERQWLDGKLEEGDKLPEAAQALYSFEVLKAIKDRYRERLLYAPVADQAQILAVTSLLIDTVSTRRGAQTCGLLARDGSAVLLNEGRWEEYAAMLDAQSSSFLSAVAASVEDPIFRQEASAEDWKALAGELTALGIPAEAIRTVLQGDPRDPMLCIALPSFMRGMALAGSEGSDRARATFVVGLAGY